MFCTLQDHVKVVVSASLINYVGLLQTTVLLDEAKIREDARNVQHKCLEKDYAALKEENKTVRLCRFVLELIEMGLF